MVKGKDWRRQVVLLSGEAGIGKSRPRGAAQPDDGIDSEIE